MINHARNLLMNVAGDQGILGLPGDEFIDPAYCPKVVPTYLQVLRNLLYGHSPDRVMLNYRTRQYLGLLHATQLEGYITALDPRITYRVDMNDLADDGVFRPVVYKTLGPASANFAVLGTPQPPDDIGQMRHALEIDVLSDTLVRVRRATPPIVQNDYEFSIAAEGQLSAPIPLPGTGYSFMLNNDQTQSWLFEVYNRPQRDINDIVVNLGSSGEPNLLQLFGTFNGDQPFYMFGQLWAQKEELPLKLGGLLIALIYRMDGLTACVPR